MYTLTTQQQTALEAFVNDAHHESSTRAPADSNARSEPQRSFLGPNASPGSPGGAFFV